MPSINNKCNPWGVFNPLSSEFKECDKIFHDELFDYPWRRAVIIIASILGAFFFIVGSFPVFCWTVKALRPGDNKTADNASSVARNILEENVQKTTKLQPVQQNRAPANAIYCIKSNRWETTDFEKFLKEMRKQGLNFDQITEDPGPGNTVVLFEFWGRPGGELEMPFSGKPQAKIIPVIATLEKGKEAVKGALEIIYNPKGRRQDYGSYAKAIKNALGYTS